MLQKITVPEWKHIPAGGKVWNGYSNSYCQGWSAKVAVDYLEIAFPKETILDIFACAGRFIGIGSRRGECYGRYKVTEVISD